MVLIMKSHIALFFSVLACCFSGVFPAPAADDPPLPSLKLNLKGMEVSSSLMKLFREQDSGMMMIMVFDLENMPGWRVAWCEEEKARVTMEDSKGSSGCDVECSYSNLPYSFFTGLAEQQMLLAPREWLPSAGAQWVRARAEVPFAVFCRESVTEPVTVKLTKGFSVPVVLKGGGLGDGDGDGKGADVEAVLTVEGYEDADAKGTRKKLSLKLTANQPLGCQACELVLMDGLPAGTKYEHSYHDRDEKTGVGWEWSAELAGVKEQELKVMIRYADSPRSVTARVDAVAALSGFSEGDVIARQNTCAPVKTGDRIEKKAPGTLPASGRGTAKDELPAVTVEWVGCHFGVKDASFVLQDVQEVPHELGWQMHVTASLPAGFGDQDVLGQNLSVTDSTGRVLKPAVCRLWSRGQDEKQGISSGCIDGIIPEWASPGAEWVHVKGEIRVPVVRVKESPVYELPLAKGAELHLPVPGAGVILDDGDVAGAGDGPTCTLSLKRLERRGNSEVEVTLRLVVEGVPFDLADFELVDRQGKALNTDFKGSSRGGNEWDKTMIIRSAAGMKQLQVRLKYKAGGQLVKVPVDVRLGLGGPIPQKKKAARK